jgi:hypothetical protein
MRPTPASLLRNIEQQIQSFLDAYPDQWRVPIQTSWLAQWRETLAVVRTAVEEPSGMDTPGTVLAAVLGAGASGLVVGWLMGCGL